MILYVGPKKKKGKKESRTAEEDLGYQILAFKCDRSSDQAAFFLKAEIRQLLDFEVIVFRGHTDI